MDLFEQLRAETRPAHDAIERLPAARAMIDGTIAREDYTELLARLYWVHEVFEDEVCRHPELASVWPVEATRAAAIANDLKALGAQQRPTPPDAIVAWADRIRTWAETNPAVWGGVGYVLEGSRMGSRMLVAPLSLALRVAVEAGTGLDYHREGCDDPGGRWRRVRTAIATLDRTAADRDALVYGAVATFEMMTAVHADSDYVADACFQVPVLANLDGSI